MTEPYKPYTGSTGSSIQTSREAAIDLPDERAETLREATFSAIKAAGDEGHTDEELQRLLHLPGNTQRPRRIELLQADRIQDSGRTRLTAAGRKAVVWILAQPKPPVPLAPAIPFKRGPR